MLKNKSLDDLVEAVELYHKNCYSCSGRDYSAIHRFVLDNGIAMDKFAHYRIPLMREWIDEANDFESKGIVAPYVKIKSKGGEMVANYNDFAERSKEIRDSILGTKPKAEAESESESAKRKPKVLAKKNKAMTSKGTIEK